MKEKSTEQLATEFLRLQEERKQLLEIISEDIAATYKEIERRVNIAVNGEYTEMYILPDGVEICRDVERGGAFLYEAIPFSKLDK